MPHLVHITTVPDSLIFLRGQVGYMRQHGYQVTAISSSGDSLVRFGKEEGVTVHAVEMPRRITPGKDLVALTRLRALLRRLSPDIVHAHTPKGGLLGMIAASAEGVPVRVYHMRGLPLMTAGGLKLALLTATEMVACGLSTSVICQSNSLRAAALERQISTASKLTVIGQGSNGVDSDVRFNPARWTPARRATVRRELRIPQDAIVFGFVGRLVKDKGIVELAQAWKSLRDEFPESRLLLVGPFESRDPVPPSTRALLEGDERVHSVGYVSDTPKYYAAMDVVTLPSYREGFPNVPLEAASMELPVVATRAAGCIDAVVNGLTGALVPVGDSAALGGALRRYAEDGELRRRHGRAGRARVQAEFRPELIWDALERYYREQLAIRRLRARSRAS